MAEVVEEKDIYERLREFVDAMPGGFPATENGVELKILKKLFAPEDAVMALCLSRQTEPVESIAERCGMEVVEVEGRLESMAARGLIFKQVQEGRALYRAEQYVVGIYEFQIPTMDREFAEMMEEYFLYLGMPMLANPTKQLRTIPVHSALEMAPAVAAYDRVRELVKEQETIVINDCVCRKQQRLLGSECGRPFEGCLGFGPMAEFYLERGLGRRASVEEALELLDHSEEAGQVLQPNNAQHIDFVCSCCSCCCGVLKNLKLFPNPAEFIESSYQAQKDREKCVECETCMERCPMDAIVVAGEEMRVDPARCIGCGVCVPSCPEEAISLVPKEGALVPPMNGDELLDRILVERGLV
ncbi:MAG: 4Fe-4S binding protein [Actinomycetota bacterium]